MEPGLLRSTLRHVIQLRIELFAVLLLGIVALTAGMNEAPLVDWDEATYAEVAHEVLIERWQTLSVWLEAERDFVLFFRLLPLALFLQGQAIFKMLLCADGHIRYQPCPPLDLRHI